MYRNSLDLHPQEWKTRKFVPTSFGGSARRELHASNYSSISELGTPKQHISNSKFSPFFDRVCTDAGVGVSVEASQTVGTHQATPLSEQIPVANPVHCSPQKLLVYQPALFSGCDGSTPFGLSASRPTHRTRSLTTSPVNMHSGISGVALERHLQLASKEELVQILLELGSCNREVFAFFLSKVGLLASGCEPIGSDAVQLKIPHDAPLGDDNIRDSNCVRRALLQDRCSPFSKLIPFSVDPLLKQNTHPIFKDSLLSTPVSQRFPKINERVHVAVYEESEDRTFADDLHPCLRWYGGCRFASSCVFISAPQNLCLNWVRGACEAGPKCSGVHRLPQGCPSEIQTIYNLNHGMSRMDAFLQARAANIIRNSWCTPKNQTLQSPPFECNLLLQHPLSVANDVLQSRHPSENSSFEGSETVTRQLFTSFTEGGCNSSQKSCLPALCLSHSENSSARTGDEEFDNFAPEHIMRTRMHTPEQ